MKVVGKDLSFGSHHRNFSIESRLMFIFLEMWNIGIHSYEPNGCKG
jgi:hypothetical protein